MESVPKKTKKVRKLKEGRIHMDRVTALEELDKLYIKGGADLEANLRQKFPKNQWFLRSTNATAIYSQYGRDPQDNQGRKWGRVKDTDEFLEVKLPRSRKYHQLGRVIDFPPVGEKIFVPSIGEFIVLDVIVGRGRTITASVYVKMLSIYKGD